MDIIENDKEGEISADFGVRNLDVEAPFPNQIYK